MKRTSLKRKPFKAKKSPLKKKPLSPEEYVKGLKMHNFFLEIWNERAHKCEVCDKSLGNSAMSYMFDHILEKSKYPNLAFEGENILLVCMECHEVKTNGFPKPKHRLEIEKTKKLFKID